jgi:hypothetical protein
VASGSVRTLQLQAISSMNGRSKSGRPSELSKELLKPLLTTDH